MDSVRSDGDERQGRSTVRGEGFTVGKLYFRSLIFLWRSLMMFNIRQTAKALYIARYDYELEKVVAFTRWALSFDASSRSNSWLTFVISSSLRIPLGNVVSLQKGVYILSPLQEAGQDPEENYGFKISFRGSDDETRLGSYSVSRVVPSFSGDLNSSNTVLLSFTQMRNQIEPSSPSKPRPKSSLRPLLLSSLKPSSPSLPPTATTSSTSAASPIITNDHPSEEIKFFAFKAIPRDVVLHGRELSVDREDAGGGQGDEKTSHEVVNGIVTRIRHLCSEAGSGWDAVDGVGGKFLTEEVSRNEGLFSGSGEREE